jgi:iron complex outermembrane recepter protein
VLLAVGSLIPAKLLAEPVDFNLPAQAADRALLAFCKQANVELLFSYDELHRSTSSQVVGRLEPEEALNRLLKGTGFRGQRSGKGKFLVARAVAPGGEITGQLLAPDGSPARSLHVLIPSVGLSVVTDGLGGFRFQGVLPGNYQVFAAGAGYQTLEIDDVRATAGRVLNLETFTMQVAREPAQLEPFVVEAKSAQSPLLVDVGAAPAPRTAIGDLDQPRSENDALSYTVFDREQIARSGVTNLNEFLKRELLDSDATTLPPEENGLASAFSSNSDNLNLRGYGSEETIVLVDGRRLPEIVTALPPSLTQGPTAPQSDVNVIPLNLIERIEVLPASASAIYSGNPVGGVINIVLRPNIDTTELTTTYTNALAGFDAPQLTTSLLNGESLLGGALRVRLNATFTDVTPPTESDLGFIQANLLAHPVEQSALYRATPNVSSASQSPLFGPGTPTIASVAPGADGSGGLAAFADRQGVQSLALFQPEGGGLADTPNSLDFPFGRKEKSMSLYGSVTYDVAPWLQLGLDANASRTVNNTGYSVFAGNLVLPSASPANPFHQDVDVTLNEYAPLLGENYDEAHIDYYTAVLGALLKMPANWQASLDAQYGLSITRYRGIQGVDNSEWQQLVNQGIYNPLRDTQVYGPPQAFYDQALIFYGAKGSFVTLGDYDTFDSALRVTNSSLSLPTGSASVTFGGDYRYARLANYVDVLRYGDGSLVEPPDVWVGRSLQRISGFGEIQAPLVPARWLPSWLRGVDADLATRYTASDLSNEAGWSPTAAIKVDFAGGLSLRGTYATSNTFPPPVFSRDLLSSVSSTSAGGAVVPTMLFDPLRQQEELVQAGDATNDIVPEAAVTQSVGILFNRGTVHRFRASVDFVDTVTSGEEIYLAAQQVVDLENLFPQRVIRAPAAPGDPGGVGVITSVLTGNFNLAWRHSYEWNTALDYAWTDCLGGTLEAYCRWIYFQRYDVEEFPTSVPVDELSHPDGETPGLLRNRMNFGAGWSDRAYGFGVDGHYFSSRILPEVEQAAQGSNQVDPYWQFDAYLQSDLGRWLPWKTARFGVRGQVRVDNVFGELPPKYANDPSGAGVQSYGDWRGRVYSVSVTVSF